MGFWCRFKDSLSCKHASTTDSVSFRSFSSLKARWSSFRSRWPKGWRAGVLASAMLVYLSLTINLTVALWLAQKGSSQDGLRVLYTGNCSKIKGTNVFIHLIINILSTFILGGSNYTMQVLAGPTRSEIDRAHSAGEWLHIGVPNVRNLVKNPGLRTVLWIVLALSSIPLHLMYNSAFYTSLGTNNYNVIIVNEQFFDGADFSISSGPVNPLSLAEIQAIQENTTKYPYEPLENIDCINAYAQNLVSDRGNLVIVSEGGRGNNSLLDIFENQCGLDSGNAVAASDSDPYHWICQDLTSTSRYYETCKTRINYVKQNATDWSVGGFDVKSCRSEKLPERCSLNANLPVVFTVTICNFIKLAIMVFVASGLRDNPLIVIGDAIQSFLNEPDENTRNCCLLSLHQFKLLASINSVWSTSASCVCKHGIAAKSRRRFWLSAPSFLRWCLTLLLLGAALYAAWFLLDLGISENFSQYPNFKALANLGFGTMNSQTLIDNSIWPFRLASQPSDKILLSILIANSPQIVLSLIYFNINGVLTSMFAADELSDFAKNRKTLRVSNPRGHQRSTYFLQLPYRIALPLIALSAMLHWLASQCIFLAVVSLWQENKLINSIQLANCGYSLLPIFFAIAIGIVITVTLVALGLRRYNRFMPLMGSNSLIIAAACHVPKSEQNPALKPLQWGVVKQVELVSEMILEQNDVGHCCFSSEEVAMPVEGRFYAGLASS